MAESSNLTDTSAYQNTGKSLKDWKKILDEAHASEKPRSDIIAFLEKHHGVQRLWAETLTTWYGTQ